MTEGRAETRGFSTFLVLWLGQTLAALGSSLTGFALAVWSYGETGGATHPALIAAFTTGPAILLSPFAGVLVDRWNRRTALAVSGAGAALGTLGLLGLIALGRLELPLILLCVGWTSAFEALRWPAMAASITTLVPKAQFGRASGLLQLGAASAQIIGPALATVLLSRIGLTRIGLVTVGLFALALLTLLPIRVPRPAEAPRESGGFLAQAWLGWSTIRERPGLLGLLLLFAAANFAMGLVTVLITPLVLAFAPSEVLGRVMSIASAGLVLGGVAMTAWGGPRRRMPAIVAVCALQGLVLMAGALRANAVWVGAVAFLFLFGFPILNGCSQTIWQLKTPEEVQGRVFAVRRMFASATLPLASVLAGPLADRLFEPALAPGGALAPTLGALIGTGPGRGVALLIATVGLFLLAAATAAALVRPVRRVEEELPDVEAGVRSTATPAGPPPRAAPATPA